MTAVHTSQEYESIASQRRSNSAIIDAPSGTGIPNPIASSSSFSVMPKAVDVYKDENEGDACENSQDERYSRIDLFLPRCALPPAEELESIEAIVESAVRGQDGLAEAAAPLKSYKALIGAIQTKKDLGVLRKILIAFRTSGRGSTLNLLTRSKKHARIIHSVLRLNPFELPAASAAVMGSNNNSPAGAPHLLKTMPDYELADAQLHFLSAVVSANAIFLIPTLTFAWKLLTSPPHENVPAERIRRCHAFLATVLRVVPKAKSELFPILSSSAPFRTRGEAELVHYYRNCLVVLRYHPGLQTSVLDMLVDKCLEMDVEIKINDLGEATLDKEDKMSEEKQDADATGVFELELDGSEQLQQPNPKKESRDDPAAVDEMASKLDALMLLLFEFISNETLSLAFLYDVFVRVFESSILICYKSKFVQYLLFYLCGLQDQAAASRSLSDPEPPNRPEPPPTLHRDFLTKLIQIVLDPYRATATRQSGACYVASFVSRARYVAPETVCEAVSALLRWAEAYLQLLDAEVADTSAAEQTIRAESEMTSPASQIVTGDDVREQCHLHSLFYTVCQSAFYIMCFRGTEALSYFQGALENSHDDDELFLQHLDMSQQRWTKVCAHPTQPLRLCLESVRVEFLALAETHSLLGATLLDRLRQQEHAPSIVKKRKAVNAIRTAATVEMERRSGGVGGLGRGQNPLDSFFPFDPFLLRRSYSFIDPFYIHWCGVAGKSGIGESVDESNPLSDATVEAFENEDDQTRDSETDISSVDDEDEGSSVGSDDADPQDDAEENASQLEATGGQPMSFVSTSSRVRFQPRSPPDVCSKREELRAAWTDTLKRSRAPSIENGSW